jgi:hypothetical protein
VSFIYGSIAFRILNVSLLCVLFNLETHLPVRSRNCAMAVVHSSPTAGLISSWLEQHQHQQHTNQPYDTTTLMCRSVAHRDPNLLLALQENSCALHGPLCYFCRCVKRRLVLKTCSSDTGNCCIDWLLITWPEKLSFTDWAHLICSIL